MSVSESVSQSGSESVSESVKFKLIELLTQLKRASNGKFPFYFCPKIKMDGPA